MHPNSATVIIQHQLVCPCRVHDAWPFDTVRGATSFLPLLYSVLRTAAVWRLRDGRILIPVSASSFLLVILPEERCRAADADRMRDACT